MNYKKLLLIVIVVAFVGVLLLSQKPKKVETVPGFVVTPTLQGQPGTSAENQPVDIVGQPAAIMEPSESETTDNYLVHDETILETITGRKVLFFYANWCPTCRPADESILAGAAEIPEGVRVIRVNYNDTETSESEKELAKQYEITYQHTFVEIDAEGGVVQKWNGGGLEELVEKLK